MELTVRQLNRALLARQLLLDRARVSVPRAVERVAGLQAQFPPGPYVGLWSRLHDFAPEQLDRALARRAVVRATLMRATVHIVSAAEYATYFRAVAPAIDVVWKRYYRREDSPLVASLVQTVIERTEEPLPAGELQQLVEAGAGAEDAQFLWFRVRTSAPLVFEPDPRGLARKTWPARYVSAAAWTGDGVDAPDPLRDLLRRYLAAFGPATIADAERWSGVPAAQLRPAIEQLPLRRVRDESGRELLDLPRAPLPPADTPAPPRFLLRWDNAIFGHADRTRIFDEELRKSIQDVGGNVPPTFLADGFVSGRWEWERAKTKATLMLEQLRPFARAHREAITGEAERLLRFLERDADVYQVRWS